MTLQTSGPISLGNINTERGTSGTISLNDSGVRSLLGVGSGTISLYNAYGKSSWQITYGGTGIVDGVLNDGDSLYADNLQSAGIYFSSNVSCVWSYTLQSSTFSSSYYSVSPSNGYNTTGASFGVQSPPQGGFQGYLTNRASWNVTVTLGGQSKSFYVDITSTGNGLDGNSQL